MTSANAIQLAPTDNVATMVSQAARGQDVTVNTSDGKVQVRAREQVPFGFKIAVRDIAAGDQVYKYGASIGQATSDIAAGTLVHIHNLAGLRAGGDTGKTG